MICTWNQSGRDGQPFCTSGPELVLGQLANDV